MRQQRWKKASLLLGLMLCASLTTGCSSGESEPAAVAPTASKSDAMRPEPDSPVVFAGDLDGQAVRLTLVTLRPGRSAVPSRDWITPYF